MLTPSSIDLVNPLIATNEIQAVSDLAKQIRFCSQIQFTGRLDVSVKDSQNHQWSLIFHRGDLTWAASELHPVRRWYRQLFQFCPQLITKTGSQNSDQHADQLQYIDYLSLLKLMRQDRVLEIQVREIVENSILEILFDIIQIIQIELSYYHRAQQIKATRRYIPFKIENLISSTSVFISAEQALQRAEQDWKLWKQAGLSEISPNLAPMIWKAKELRHQISATAYHNLFTLVDGDRTFRDLAVKLKQNVLDVVQSIKPYIDKDLIKLIEAGDLHSSNKLIPVATSFKHSNSSSEPTQPQPQPLIAYVDDSQFDRLTMSDILVQHGYRFINIQDPIQALPLLLELRPSIILLDLVMPYTNGYEVCTQIRRTTVLKQTPVIIVTSSDGIIDRVRARIAGASGFLAKPISPEKVLTILRKHLPSSLLSPPQRSIVRSN